MEKHDIFDLTYRIFDYFQKHTNLDKKSQGYGLSLDHSKNLEVASIASTGFYLSSLVIGVEHNFIEYAKAYDQALFTIKNLYHHIENYKGFFYHFYDYNSGKRFNKTEVSTIDTTLCLCGIVTVASYFKNEIESISQKILKRIDWEYFIFNKNDKSYVHMAYNPDRDGDYANGISGFIHQWDMFAEQLAMYIFVANSLPDIALKLYEDFNRIYAFDGTYRYIMTPGNTLFVYQFPLCWLDLKDVVDRKGICWFDNAKKATLSHQKCSMNNQHIFKTFSKTRFGFTANHTPQGYRVFQAMPNVGKVLKTDGTVSPCSPLGSFVLTPELSQMSFNDLLSIDGLYGPYGFYDGFNFENDNIWISDRYYGINQGLILLMIDAATHKNVYRYFMSHDIVKRGMDVLKWKKK